MGLVQVGQQVALLLVVLGLGQHELGQVRSVLELVVILVMGSRKQLKSLEVLA